MAVPTSVLDGAIRRTASCDRVDAVIKSPWMSRVEMAPLAQVGLLGDEHLVVTASVRVMTGDATLADRRVLPQKRSPLFRMALVTLLIDRRSGEHLGICRIVRVVARSAAHEALANRVMRRSLQLRSYVFVTAGAQFRFADGLEVGARRLETMDGVT